MTEQLQQQPNWELYLYAREPRKARIAKFLAERDGLKCKMWGHGPSVCEKMLEIHHVLGPFVWDYDKLCLLCHSHNSYMNGKNAHTLYPSDVRERENSTTHTHTNLDTTTLIRQEVDFSTGSPEMKVNGLTEVPYRNWLTAYLKVHGWISKKDAIASGAEVVGISIQTTRRHLDKCVSPEGPLEEEKDEFNRRVIRPKEKTKQAWIEEA